jgi:ABC-type long-subunit fatty acid transport system fused permease/ATPase subunit
MKNIIQRLQEPTPRFFRKIRNMGLLLTAVSGAVLTAPVTLPAVLMTAAGYLAIAGAIASAISQTAVTDEGQP